MKNTEFVNRVLEIAASNPTYRTGGDGSDGTCDCIGLVMGAVGKKFPVHSTNYFARYEIGPLGIVDDWDESELDLGVLVFKARQPGNPRYDLNDRYKAGGRYDTGDLTDYYHVGVVTNTSPFTITHCTSSNDVNGIDYDDSLTGWTHIARVLGMEFSDEDVQTRPASNDLAVVISEDGNPVRLRSKPVTDSYNTIVKVPHAAQVEVLERAGDWATVRWDGKRGYMMSRYLRTIGMIEADPAPAGTVTVTLSTSAAKELLEALNHSNLNKQTTKEEV